jgi:excisionase family DNA binding protein
MKKLTVSEAAARLGVTTRRVIALINAESEQKRLRATRFGRAWVISEADLKKVEERKPGRPPKASTKQKGVKGD